MNRLHILGTGSGISVGDRFKTSIVIETDKKNYMLDAGEGCSYVYRKQNLNFNNLRSLFFSHIHLDHISGVFQLIEDMKLEYYLNSKTNSNRYFDIYIPQIAPKDFELVLKILNIKLNDKFNIQVNKVTTGMLYSDENVTVTSHRTMHEVTSGIISYGYMIDLSGKKIYYSGDLDSISEIKGHISLCDIAIVELAHYDLEDITPFVKDFKGLLVLSHIGKKYGDKRSSEYRNLISFMNSLNIRYVIAEDGIVFDLD